MKFFVSTFSSTFLLAPDVKVSPLCENKIICHELLHLSQSNIITDIKTHDNLFCFHI